MEGSLTPPAVTLVLGLVTAVLAFLAPIALKLIDQRTKPTVPVVSPPPPQIDIIADMDNTIARMDREIERLREQLTWERSEHQRDRTADGHA